MLHVDATRTRRLSLALQVVHTNLSFPDPSLKSPVMRMRKRTHLYGIGTGSVSATVQSLSTVVEGSVVIGTSTNSTSSPDPGTGC